ncbi:hypothetical protein BJF83_06440 [Nocardiopsis sp. CNR-923]|uniref:hypothetical protein n=1 Tax=Nocardiopsis sp. CNR-923 TaxID=1904965 RepID=UPI0009620E7C|nr:hypothetical protein [Nocardiopsis sp. CNR-923]OLT24617.1 hypothetical protein BJF83_06440 [Nocardiopsis sp. CNR-923]
MSPVPRPRVMAVAAATLAVPCAVYLLPPVWAVLWAPAVLLAVAVLASPPAGPDVLGATGEDGLGGEERTHPAQGEARSTGTRVRTVALACAVEDHRLDFSAEVHWRWEGHVDLRLRNPAGPAVHAVVTRAAELARDVDPVDHGLAETALGALLAVERAVTGAGIVVWAQDVRLRLPDEDAERLRRMAALRKDRALREEIREAEEDLAELPPPPMSTASRAVSGPDDDEDDFEELAPFDGPDAAPPPGPGSDVDGEGYESYWWPAEDRTGSHAAEQDVQVAILRGLIDSARDAGERTAFARDQVRVLERSGFTQVASRLRGLFPETAEADADPHEPP